MTRAGFIAAIRNCSPALFGGAERGRLIWAYSARHRNNWVVRYPTLRVTAQLLCSGTGQHWAAARGSSHVHLSVKDHNHPKHHPDTRQQGIRAGAVISHQPFPLFLPFSSPLLFPFVPHPLFSSFPHFSSPSSLLFPASSLARHCPAPQAQHWMLLHNSSLPSRHSTPHRACVVAHAQNLQDGAQKQNFCLFSLSTSKRIQVLHPDFPLRCTTHSDHQKKIQPLTAFRPPLHRIKHPAPSDWPASSSYSLTRHRLLQPGLDSENPRFWVKAASGRRKRVPVPSEREGWVG